MIALAWPQASGCRKLNQCHPYACILIFAPICKQFVSPLLLTSNYTMIIMLQGNREINSYDIPTALKKYAQVN